MFQAMRISPTSSILAVAALAFATLTSPLSVATSTAMPAAPGYAPAATIQPELAQHRRHAPRRHVRRGGGNAGAAAAAMVGVLALGALAASAAQSYDYDDYYAPAPVYGGYGYGYRPRPYYRARPAYRPHYAAPYQGPRYYGGQRPYAPQPYRGQNWGPRHGYGGGAPVIVGPPDNSGGK